MTAGVTDAEDAVQEALLRAWKSYDSLEDQGKAKSWLLTIVRRELARRLELARATGRSASGTRARLARLLDRLRSELTDV